MAWSAQGGVASGAWAPVAARALRWSVLSLAASREAAWVASREAAWAAAREAAWVVAREAAWAAQAWVAAWTAWSWRWGDRASLATEDAWAAAGALWLPARELGGAAARREGWGFLGLGLLVRVPLEPPRAPWAAWDVEAAWVEVCQDWCSIPQTSATKKAVLYYLFRNYTEEQFT